MLKKLYVVIAVLGLPGLVYAQPANPKFEYAKEEEAKKAAKLEKVEWKAGAAAGLVITTGNSETETITGTATASRRDKDNRLLIEANGAYARSTIFLANDINGNGTIDNDDEIRQTRQTTTKQWLFRSRYDRFLTTNNSLFASAAVGANQPAGKDFIANGQLGYSRTIVKNKVHEVVGEGGYDYTYENLTTAQNSDINIHSVRAFLGYKGKVSKETEVASGFELLINLNEVDLPTQTAEVGEDTRVNSATTLTTKLFKNISFRFGFTVLYDNAPAPRPGFSIPFAAGFVPPADKVDTKTEASLIINFL
ncbi:MAG: DUF481 domain-containing protein [Deltaproteobacteria bacterium]|nr:DUF481 domain-containing protein [Deltaproteobacteria bacterium]